MTVVLALALAQGCWRDGPVTRATVQPVPETSAAPVTPASSMTKAADAVGMAPVQKYVVGTARTAKLAPAVILEDGTPVYCLGAVDAWPAAVEGTRVTATGMLEATAEFAGGLGEAGTGGAVWVLRGCTFTAP